MGISRLLIASSIGLSTALCSGLTVAPIPAASATRPPIAEALKSELRAYIASNAAPEHISAASLSVRLAGKGGEIDVAAGTTSIGGSIAVTPQNVFQIGSNTKAFTAVALLHLEADGKLSVTDTVGKWLPQYPQWKDIKLTQLLDMTSRIATYDDTREWDEAVTTHPDHTFTPQELIAFVASKPPLKPGWHYSNTGYILAQLIIEKASKQSYADYIRGIFAEADLHDTYYEPSFYPESVYSRLVDGYYFNDDPGNEGLASLLRKNVRSFSLSWTQAAGGIVATPSDVVKWAHDLYTGPILAAKQRAEMDTLVSTKTGLPIAAASDAEPRGFGLGITDMYRAPLGIFRFYEGETLGYRVAHIYVPSTDTTIAVGLNSQAPGSKDQAGPFLSKVYETLVSYGLAGSSGSRP
jgi:D-alanyl-D-alanine carboxypeptidase